MTEIFSCEFEVYGKVQGVFFRKYTQRQAKLLELKGYCMNTRSNTVKGVMEGSKPKMEEMKIWLQSVGSPMSKIEKTVLSEMKPIKAYSFQSFSIKH